MRIETSLFFLNIRGAMCFISAAIPWGSNPKLHVKRYFPSLIIGQNMAWKAIFAESCPGCITINF